MDAQMSESLQLSSGLFMGSTPTALSHAISLAINAVNLWIPKQKVVQRVPFYSPVLFEDPYIVLHLILKTAAQEFRKLLEKLGEIVISKAQAPQ
ncbi:hypothetical protein AKJ16_DCAP11938, partial [Drosera capensis]